MYVWLVLGFDVNHDEGAPALGRGAAWAPFFSPALGMGCSTPPIVASPPVHLSCPTCLLHWPPTFTCAHAVTLAQHSAPVSNQLSAAEIINFYDKI